jgi:hypothetical protein
MCEGKIFLVDRVRIALNTWLSSRAKKTKCAGTLDFIGLIARLHLKNFSGAVIAIDYVGQRDTKWLVPLTVSGWRQGEEGASQISSACSYPTTASAFIFVRSFQK